jgi:predicted transcriptional regulator
VNVSKIMTKKVISVEKNTSMSKAITLMDSKEIKELPVVHNKKYFGLLVYYDLISNEALKSDKIEKFVRKVAVLSPKDSIDKAIRSMQMNGMGAIPITDEDDKLVGIVSDYDIIKLLINSRVFDSLKVEDVVIRRFPILRTEDTLGKAQKLAALNRVDGLPIIDNFGKVVGQVLLSDILRYTFAVVAGKKSDKKGMDANKDTALEKNVMEISRRELPQISLTLNLRKALEMMLSAKIKGSIVVDNDGKPVGILSRLKILDMLGGKSIGDNIDVQLSGEYDWDFILLIRSEINKRERLFYNEAGIQRMKIHVKKIRDITGKYQLNLLASGKKNFNVKVEGVVKDLLLQEALEKLENMLEHNRRDF